MDTAQTAFPFASIFLFQPDAGIQISILISESLLGRSVAATLQSAGGSWKETGSPRHVLTGTGFEKPPASKSCGRDMAGANRRDGNGMKAAPLSSPHI
jgi:hypothetical protein